MTSLSRSIARASGRGAGAPALLPGLAIGAAVLAAAALANHAVARRTERRHPPRGRFLEVDGVRLHLTERGSGPAVVLLHGNGATAQDFEASGLVDRLAAHHRVIAFDRPGFGHSERPRTTVWTAGAQAALLRTALRRGPPSPCWATSSATRSRPCSAGCCGGR